MRPTIIAAAMLAALTVTGAGAAEYRIEMLNKGADGAMVFEPAFVKAEPGDTIVFVPTDKGHNAETVKDMLPEGVQPVKGKMNAEVRMTVDKEGIYGIKCMPHYTMGMVALVQVGAATNLAQAQAVKAPGKAKERFDALFARVVR
ncbi:MAG: pseudoazurin [Flavobacteriaceae bacterium]